MNKVHDRLRSVFPRHHVDVWEAGPVMLFVSVAEHISGPITFNHSVSSIVKDGDALAEFERTCMEVFGGR